MTSPDRFSPGDLALPALPANLDRRRALALLAALLAPVVVPGCRGEPRAGLRPVAPPLVWDVIVVGGGLAGLSATAAVARAGRSVLVLEAQSRLGGRVDTARVADGGATLVAERGAQLFHRDMTTLRDLLRRSGGRTVRLPDADARVLVDAAGRRLLPAEDVFATLDEATVARALGPGDLSLAELLDRLLPATPGTRARRDLVRSALTELVSLPLEVVSARAMLAELATQAPVRDDELQAPDGLDVAVAALAAQLLVAPRLGVAVSALRPHPGGIAVHVDAGAAGRTPAPLLARRVVVAAPPPVARRLDLPALAPRVREALDGWVSGTMVKVTCVFGERFWQAPGAPGRAAPELVSLAPFGVTGVDVSHPDRSEGRLVLFAGGATARAWAALDAAARAREALALVRRAYADGTSADGASGDAVPMLVPAPRLVVEGVWVDHPWSGGGYDAHVRAGGNPDAAAVLRAVDGLVTFAGAELATRYAGYMEGALRSGAEAGRRAARALAGRTARSAG